MTNVWFSNRPSFTTRSILALPVKWGTLNLPPLIASTSGSVDQIKCLTPASIAARIAAVACLSSSAPPYAQKLVTRKTPCAPSNAALSVRFVDICLDDFLCEFAMLVGIASQCAHLELSAGLQGTYDSAALLPSCADHGDQFPIVR